MSIILDATTKSLELLLAAATTTNAMSISTQYFDTNNSTGVSTPGVQDAQSNGVTPVTIVSTPASNHTRTVTEVIVLNLDTASNVVTVQVNNSSVLFVLTATQVSIGWQLLLTASGAWVSSGGQLQSTTPAGGGGGGGESTVTIVGSLPGGTNTIGKTLSALGTTGGPVPTGVISADGTNATLVKASPGQLYGWYLFNNAATISVVHVYNSATIPTAGSGTPLFDIVLPIGGGSNVAWPWGVPFSAGIGFTITGGIGNTDTTSVSANDVTGLLLYN